MRRTGRKRKKKKTKKDVKKPDQRNQRILILTKKILYLRIVSDFSFFVTQSYDT
jgi:hypothetical protein